jgi:ribosomal protein S18 acetylase RimI-like enzyme
MLDRSLLFKFMHRTYQELFPNRSLAHLSQTVENYLSTKTPLWWVECLQPKSDDSGESGTKIRNQPVACLWMGTAIDQVQGDRHSHIFLLYVDPAHRRQGIGKRLLEQAETWARSQGDRQITLQVFCENQPALKLYQQSGYQLQALALVKKLD